MQIWQPQNNSIVSVWQGEKEIDGVRCIRALEMYETALLEQTMAINRFLPSGENAVYKKELF